MSFLSKSNLGLSLWSLESLWGPLKTKTTLGTALYSGLISVPCTPFRPFKNYRVGWWVDGDLSDNPEDKFLFPLLDMTFRGLWTGTGPWDCQFHRILFEQFTFVLPLFLQMNQPCDQAIFRHYLRTSKAGLPTQSHYATQVVPFLTFLPVKQN